MDKDMLCQCIDQWRIRSVKIYLKHGTRNAKAIELMKKIHAHVVSLGMVVKIKSTPTPKYPLGTP